MFHEMISLNVMTPAVFQEIRFAKCQFGFAAMKTTIVWCWHCPPVSPDLVSECVLGKDWAAVDPAFARTSRRSTTFSLGAVKGVFLTSAASEYTPALGMALARMVKG